jgi:hypothetical protein
VTFFLMASSFWALSRTVLHGGLLGMEADLVGIARLKNAYLIAIIWNVLCMLALQLNVVLALVMWGLMFGVFAFPGEFAQLVHEIRGGAGAEISTVLRRSG